MKILIWIVVALVIIGGIFWFISSTPPEPIYPENDNQPSNQDQLSANGRALETDTDVFNEIDDAMGQLP